jgi:asparagine synthase (glutamine-hydrolysing)
MLAALKHRGPVRHVESPDEGSTRNVALGLASLPSTQDGIAVSPKTVTVLDGSFYARGGAGNAQHVLCQVKALSTHKALKATTRALGGFACLVAERNTMYAFRDVNGLKPLYFARSSHLAAFASERKALWAIGLSRPSAVPPGSVIKLTKGRVAKRKVAQFRRPNEGKMTLKRATVSLQRLLETSIQRITRNVGKVCVAFSGGLDSAVTATMAKSLGVHIRAVSVGLKDSSELSSADRYAKQLGLENVVEAFDQGSIEEYVRRVLWLIEEPNLMKLSVAIPLHWAAMVASQCGCNVMLCGQGSDELYGGYAKYARTLKAKGRRALVAQLYQSVVDSSQVNYERDDQATSLFGVELRTPFADPDLIKFSLTIPSEFKVKDGDDVTRKWVLREVARRAGVPDEIAWRRKKAIQHGTGVEKAILRLAKGHGQPADEYLSRTFEEVRGLESMP